MATTAAYANESALARNLLNSVLALAFPENLATDAAAQQLFVAQLPQIQRILQQQNVFGLVGEGKALDKFQAKLFQLIDQPPAVLDKQVRAAAFELQLTVVQQCAMEQLEQLTPKLIERVIKTVKYQQDAISNPAVVPALQVATVVVRNIELLTPEVRRELYDNFSKFLPAVLSQLQALGSSKSGELAPSDVQLWVSGVELFTELLEVSPNALRIYATKIEQACALMFQQPQAFASSIAVGAKCLGLLANASDKTPQLWKQILERAVEVVNLQLDLLSGKRAMSQAQQQQQLANLKGWVKDSGAAADANLSVYQRSELALLRLQIAADVIAASMKSRAISEREVQLVINDVITLARRALAVRATEIGKQTALSDDGFRLPASVVYGILPRVQELALRILSVTVERAGLCALRHASKIIKVLRLASENGSRDAHDALYAAIGVCVRSLGASTVEKLGVPLLEEMVTRCKGDLENKAIVVNDDATANAPTALADKKSAKNSSSNNNNKGKKRKRQAEVSQLSESAANTLPFVSTHSQLLLARNVDAALLSIATCVGVYGSILPMAARSAASELSLFAVQQRAKQRFQFSAAAAMAIGTNGVDAAALMLLTDATSADATGAHGANLITGLNYWLEHSRHAAILNGSNGLSTMLQLVALNAGETLLHPRAPPLSITFQDALGSDAKKQHQAQQQRLLGSSGYTASAVRGGRANGAEASGVRGRSDWDDADKVDEQQQEENDEDEPMSESPKKQKTEEDEEEEVVVEETVVVVEQEEEEEEEDYDDVRPAQEEQKVTKAKPAEVDDDDDDDDEFPDIVVDDEEDE
ncbi:hypothetical protein Gpo141_00000062 [Globisporangium polare]